MHCFWPEIAGYYTELTQSKNKRLLNVRQQNREANTAGEFEIELNTGDRELMVAR